MSDDTYLASLVASVEGYILKHAEAYALRCPQIDLADFAQEGRLAALLSAQQYDATRGVCFLGFAYRRILGAMGNFLVHNSLSVRLPHQKIGKVTLQFTRIDEHIPNAKNEESRFTFAEFFPDPADTFAEVCAADLRARLEPLIAGLTHKQRTALRLRFWEGLKLEEIGERMGCTREAARKALRGSLERLARAFDLRTR